MGKPYGFRLSDQTSGDQYLGAMWGLWRYLAVAPPAHAAQARTMIVDFARYWRRVDYQIFYLDRVWDQKREVHSYNAIYTALNRLAHQLTGAAELRRGPADLRPGPLAHRDEGRRVAPNAARAKPATGNPTASRPGPRGRASSSAGKRPSIALSPPSPAPSSTRWRRPGDPPRLGRLHPALVGDLAARHRRRSPAPRHLDRRSRDRRLASGAARTPRLPREQWFLSQPHLSHINSKRWNEPLARFVLTSVFAAEHDPALAPDAIALAQRIFDRLDGTRLLWQVDPDGRQIDPDLSDVRNVLSSEVPAACTAAFWRGRRFGWW